MEKSQNRSNHKIRNFILSSAIIYSVLSLFSSTLSLASPKKCSLIIAAESSTIPSTRNLVDAPIVKMKPMRDYLEEKGIVVSATTESYFVEFSSGEKGIAKTTESHDGMVADGFVETGFYRFALRVKSDRLVPPTFLRKIKGQLYSVQLLVEQGKHPKSITEIHGSQMNKRDQVESELLMFITGKWDRHFGNFIVPSIQQTSLKVGGQTSSLALIDNASIKVPSVVRYGELPYLKWLPLKEGINSVGKEKFFDQARLIKPLESAEQVILEYVDSNFQSYIKKTLSDMEHEKSKQFRLVPSDGFLWIQLKLPSYYPLKFKSIPRDTWELYRSLDYETIDHVFLNKFSPEKIHQIQSNIRLIEQLIQSGEVLLE